jgi:hypothetical protein
MVVELYDPQPTTSDVVERPQRSITFSLGKRLFHDRRADMTSHPLKGLIERTGLQSVSRAAQDLQENSLATTSAIMP